MKYKIGDEVKVLDSSGCSLAGTCQKILSIYKDVDCGYGYIISKEGGVIFDEQIAGLYVHVKTDVGDQPCNIMYENRIESNGRPHRFDELQLMGLARCEVFHEGNDTKAKYTVAPHKENPFVNDDGKPLSKGVMKDVKGYKWSRKRKTESVDFGPFTTIKDTEGMTYKQWKEEKDNIYMGNQQHIKNQNDHIIYLLSNIK